MTCMACQKVIDLALTCPDAEQIIQKTMDSGIKAKFQHICEARVFGFEVNQYIDIDVADLFFSLEDLQYLWYHFEVFLAVSLFDLTTDKKEHMTHLDAYLDTRNACITYQEQTRRALQVQNQVPTPSKPEVNIALMDMPHERILVVAEDD